MKKVIESGVYHHLGDDTVDWMHNTRPEGSRWSKSFSLAPMTASMATIVITVADLQGADLLINGFRFALPTITDRTDSDAGMNQLYRNVSLTLPAGLFRFGRANALVIQSLQNPVDDTYDDFEMSSIWIYFQ